jgi:N-acetyl-1-D-myo-inositol-2-amino-2-deoxy-alpha-D-glucopyranoside deacetylase
VVDRAGQRLLLMHAHPDDEAINNGATMARYVAEGAQVTLVTSTLGELGEILVPQLAGLAADRADQLGGYRMCEMDEAMRALGVADHRYLGGPGRWRDSGMMGTESNADPRAFWRAGDDAEMFDSAVTAALAVIREVRPQVLVTYDENGGYGHPDHIMTHRVAMAAVDRAAAQGGEGKPWQLSKVYWNAFSRKDLQRGIDAVKADGETWFEGVDSADDLPFGDDEAHITTTVDARSYVEAKRAAMRAHATQISVDGPFFALSNNIGLELAGIEQYHLARGALGPDRDATGRETDLFSGVA